MSEEINHYINLKTHIIDSLKSQGMRENWTYPTLRDIGFTIKDVKQFTD